MPTSPIRTPDQRLRVFVSSTLGELAPERQVARRAIERLRLTLVMFEMGARPHPPRSLYRAYLSQSHVFLGIYWQRYGWVAPGETISGLEDEYRLAGRRPRLLYIKGPAPEREDRLKTMLGNLQTDDNTSYKHFETLEELENLVQNDLALLLSERFEAGEVGGEAMPRRQAAPPVPLTPTVGRETELRRVVDEVRAGRRLVTLTGPGGVGKTRIAVEAAHRLEEDLPNGVFFVALAEVHDATLVGRTVVDKLAIRTEGARTALDALEDFFSGGRSLLVLDNLEQIGGIETFLHSLLERARELRVLATSRRALRVAGERDIAIQPLATEPAVELFIERARDAGSIFDLAGDVPAAIEDICRRLDGLPLAIELAAARARLLTPVALLARLGQGLDLLRSLSSDLPERQQTLRATLEWSQQLLGEAERRLLARLSAFSGGFTLEAAEWVCDPEGRLGVMDALTVLLDSSLVLVSEEPDLPATRFRMLETVRAFAREQLAAGGEEAILAKRHLDWFARLAEEAQPSLCGPNQKIWAGRIEPERANVRAAMTTAFEIGALDVVVEMVWDLAVFYDIRDASDEPRSWLGAVVERHPDFGDVLRAKLLVLDTRLRMQVGDHDVSIDTVEWGLGVFRQHGMDFESAVTLTILAHMRFGAGDDRAKSIEALDEASRLFAAVGHDWGVAGAQIMLTLVLWSGGDPTGAEQHLRESLLSSRAITNEPQISRALALLAMLAAGRGDDAQILPLLREACDIVIRGQYRTEATFCLAAAAGLLMQRGDARAAGTTVALAEALRRGLVLPAAPGVERFLSSVLESSSSALGSDMNPVAPDDVFDYLTQLVQGWSAQSDAQALHR